MEEVRLKSTNDYLVNLRSILVSDYKNLDYGIRGLLEYRLHDCKEDIDKNARKFFKDVYGKEEESQDTIFNCWSIFRIFAWNRFKDMGILSEIQSYTEKKRGCLDHLEEIFDGYNDFRELFDVLSELHHCFANFMPAPREFNGCSNHDGKGKYLRDNDFPDIYFQRSEKDFPDNYQWIIENKDRYALSFFWEFKSDLKDRKATQISGPNRYEKIKYIVEREIACIKKRAIEISKIYFAESAGLLMIEEPEQWGLRGDPYLWDEMRANLRDQPLNLSEEKLEQLLFDKFKELTGHSLTCNQDDFYNIDKYSHGGMSSGGISCEFWYYRGIPMILDRYKELLK